MVWINISSAEHAQIPAAGFDLLGRSHTQIFRTRPATERAFVHRRGSVHSRVGLVLVANKGADLRSRVPMASAYSDASHSTTHRVTSQPPVILLLKRVFGVITLATGALLLIFGVSQKAF